MLTRHQANAYLCVILETVAECPQGAPSGPIYAALMCRGVSLDEYQLLVSLAKQGELITESSHVLRLTDKGFDVVKKIKATLDN